jgi:hypothetical protein
VWRLGDLSFELDDEATSDPVVTAVVATPNGLLRFMAEPQVVGSTLVLKGLHTFGVGVVANAVGPANLRVVADMVMERMGFDGIVVEGAVRTTGANPGHRPGRIRFARRVRPVPAR